MRKIILLSFLFFVFSITSLALVEADYFSFKLPDGYEEVEKENQLIARTFQNDVSKIRVFNQSMEKQSFADYVEYGNAQLYQGKAGFSLLKRESLKINGKKVELFTYKRPPIEALERDQNFYIEGHLYDSQRKRAITVWAKTGEANKDTLRKDIEEVFKSLAFTNKAAIFSWNYPYHGEEKEIILTGSTLELKIPADKILWGRFFPGFPFYEGGADDMRKSEEKLDHRFEFLMAYKNFPLPEPFPIEEFKAIYDDGRIGMITLQPLTLDLKWIAVPEFLTGQHDEKIIEMAQMLKSIDEPVFVRLLNEMNGDWDPWCAWFFGKDTDLYIYAWQHIVDLMRDHGGDKLIFVWNPHDRSYPDFDWNNAHLYYPGDAYVDWVGLTGYNNGTSHPGDIWRDFDQIYKPLYADYLQRYSAKPFMITEFSTNEHGGSKIKWLEEGFRSLAKNYPNIKIATWFDGQDGLWEYQIDSSPSAATTFRRELKNPGFALNTVSKSLTK